MNNKNILKIFISYRATQSMFVRQIADQLISAGCEVWFAEYETFDWQLRQNDLWLKSKISGGIAQSVWGIVFVSDDYMASGHCENELRELLDQLGVQRILQISLDGTQLEQLAKSETIHCTSDDVMEAVDFITYRVGMSMAYVARPGRTLRDMSKIIKVGGQFKLDSYGWKKWWRGTLDALLTPYDVGQRMQSTVKWGPFLQRDATMTGGNLTNIFMNLHYGKEEPANYDKWAINFRDIQNAAREKEVLNKLNEYASCVHFQNIRHLGVGVQLHGVHLLLKGNTFGHVGITYEVRTETDAWWTRKVSIHLPDPLTHSFFYEFVFTFAFRGSFREYCRYTGIMDDLALSIDIA